MLRLLYEHKKLKSFNASLHVSDSLPQEINTLQMKSLKPVGRCVGRGVSGGSGTPSGKCRLLNLRQLEIPSSMAKQNK